MLDHKFVIRREYNLFDGDKYDAIMSIMALHKTDKRQQINIRVDADFLRAVDEIRRMTAPIPSVTEAIKNAVFAHRDHLRRRTERDRQHD